MFIFLTKKIQFPGDLFCLAWGSKLDYIACGPPLHVFEPNSVAELLECEKPKKIIWNISGKLTTCDGNGCVVVYGYNNSWVEELINDGKCSVSDFRWNKTGSTILILYEDGTLIIGGIDGNRILKKEVGPMLFGDWAPNSDFMVLAPKSGGLFLHDDQANLVTSIPLHESNKITGLEWGGISGSCSYVAICFQDKVQISQNTWPLNPVLIETKCKQITLKWNNLGLILAVAGVQDSSVVVQLYTVRGEYLRYLSVQGTSAKSVAWDYLGLRLALGVDNTIFLCSVRPEYTFAYAGTTICYSLSDMFLLDHHSNTFIKKQSACLILSNQKHFTIVSKMETNQISVINTKGTPLDTRSIGSFTPITGCMSDNFVVVCDELRILFFPYQKTHAESTVHQALWQKESTVKIFHIDQKQFCQNQNLPEVLNSNKIVSVGTNESLIVIAKSNGEVFCFSFPLFNPVAQFDYPQRIHRAYLNFDCSKLAVVDFGGNLGMLSLNQDKFTSISFERKDVWDLMWSAEDPNLFAVMEKSKMVVFRDLEPEDAPQDCSTQIGYFGSFNDLKIRVIDMDNLSDSSPSNIKSVVFECESKLLRSAKHVMETSGFDKAMEIIEKNPHPALIREIGNQALINLDLNNARRCMIKLQDYVGITLVKRLQNLARTAPDPKKEKALALVHLGRINEAEDILNEIDRPDLIFEVNYSLGNWSRVVQMGKTGGATDSVMEKCWSLMGDSYAASGDWVNAAPYYSLSRNFSALAQCYYYSENVGALAKLSMSLPPTSRVLCEIGDFLVLLGECSDAVAAFVRYGAVESAINACVLFNEWHTALELAKGESGKELMANLHKTFATRLKEEKNVFLLISLYRRAGLCAKSAALLFDKAKSEAHAIDSKVPPLTIKKLYVLAALEMERYNALYPDALNSEQDPLESLMKEISDISVPYDRNNFENPWHGAEAYHYYLQSQKHYHDADFHGALRFVCLNLT